jgi:hypothetical protein
MGGVAAAPWLCPLGFVWLVLSERANDKRAIQAYLGRRNIQNTTRFTALAPQRFKEFFRD